MDDKQIKRIKEAMRPEPEVKQVLFEKVAIQKNRNIQNFWPKLTIVMSVIICGFFGLEFMNNNQTSLVLEPISFTGLPFHKKEESQVVYESSPLERYSITTESSRVDRIASGIAEFLSNDVSVVLIRVDEAVNKDSESIGFETQDIKATVLSHIRGNTVGESLTFTNYLVSEMTSLWSEETQEEPMRKGGVYILPLQLIETDSYYHVGTFDFLFEVDDKGVVNSHSKFKSLSQYDGMKLADFIFSLYALETNKTYVENLDLSGMLENDTYVLVDNYRLIETQIMDNEPIGYIYEADVIRSLGTGITGSVLVYAYTDDSSTFERSVYKTDDGDALYYQTSLENIKNYTGYASKSEEAFLQAVETIQTIIIQKNNYLKFVILFK